MVNYAHNIPGIRSPKEDQLGLQMRHIDSPNWGAPFNYSYKTAYLKQKMKEHRFNMVAGGFTGSVEYRIVDKDGKEYFNFTYGENEYEDVKKRPSQSKYQINFKRITDEKDPAGYYFVIVDENDKCLTNIDLLMYLRESVWKDMIEMPNRLKPLAYISTYIPASMEDFDSAYGFGEKQKAKLGPYFLKKIEEFSDNQ